MNARWCISTPPPGFVVIGNLTVSGPIVIPYFILCYTVIRHFTPNADPGGQLKHNLMNLTSVRHPLYTRHTGGAMPLRCLYGINRSGTAMIAVVPQWFRH